MDFDRAAERLARDQKKLRGRAGRPAPSVRAREEADARRQQQQRMAVQRKREEERRRVIERYMGQCERTLGVRNLSSAERRNHDDARRFTPTSIHGDGDKIALPVSVLEYLTQAGIAMSPDTPWIFRIAIPNPDYAFPASPLLRKIAVAHMTDNDDDDDDDDAMADDAMADDNDNDLYDENDEHMVEAYLDELSHKYLAYTHGSVVEFTQEEGHVGLPEATAAALQEQCGTAIPFHRTKDPASTTNKMSNEGKQNNKEETEDEVIDQTPGHLAWGAFDVPDVPVEVSLVRLPKGEACTLQPTKQAIRNGFYNLKDIKLVLEQSLSRTRATLSVKDLVHTWHRGIKYDLTVTQVSPATYNAVVCINTDITVDFAAPPSSTTEENVTTTSRQQEMPSRAENVGGIYTLGSSEGRTLGSIGTRRVPMAHSQQQSAEGDKASMPMQVELRPEPPLEQTTNVCTVQIRGDGATGRRRFDVQLATMTDLFDFARSVVRDNMDFCLVSRFPRRIFQLQEGDDDRTLADAGLAPGQELLMVERI